MADKSDETPLFDRFKVTLTTAGAAAKLLLAQLRGVGDEGDDKTAEPTDDAAFLQQLGVAARPLIATTLRALGYRHDDEVWILKMWDRALVPTDLAEGETRVFAAGKTTVRIRCLADGSLHIDSDGGDVVINGGTAAVGRVGDQVQVTIPINALTLAVSGASANGPAAPLTVTGTIQAGASNVKA